MLPATRSGMPADIFGQRIGDDIRAVVQRALPQGAKERVVDRNRAIGKAHCIARIANRLDIDQRIGRIARAFEVDHRNFPTLILR